MSWLARVGIAVAVGLALGFALGRGSLEPLDTRLADSLVATRGQFTRDTASLAAHLRAELAEGVADSTRAAHSAQRAGAAQAAANRERLRGRAVQARLDSARTASDSVPLLVSQVAGVRAERDSLAVAADGFRFAWEQERASGARLRAGVDSMFRVERVVWGARLSATERALADAVKQQKGCRVPILGVRCPVLGIGYGVTASDGTASHGLTVAVVLPIR